MIRIIRFVFLMRGWLVTRWLRFWLKQADAVVSVSKYVQGVLTNYGIRSQVIYNTFDTSFFNDEFNKVRPWESKVGPLNTILFVGKPSYGKGYDLFRSLSRNKLFEKYKFVTIGGSNKLPYLETLQKIKESAVVVVPSRWPEPFGRVALESLMIGTPVVASRRGGLTEIIKDGVTGVLVEPNVDVLAIGLKKLIEKNAEFRENIHRRKRKYKEKFTKMPVEEHLKLYNEESRRARSFARQSAGSG